MFVGDEWFSFHKELMDVVDVFIEGYLARQGEFENDLDRGAVTSFALGALTDDLDEIWEVLSSAAVFEGVSPRNLFERGEYGSLPEGEAVESESLLAEMRSRGWVQ